jgi:hypothetical protein
MMAQCTAARPRGSKMVWFASRRSVRHLVVLGFMALSSGHAAAQSATKCLNTASARAPSAISDDAYVLPLASKTPIWKTITIGGTKGVIAVRVAMDTAPCPIWVGDEADEVLGRPAFPFVKAPVDLDLVVLSVFEFGFGDRASRSDPERGGSVEMQRLFSAEEVTAVRQKRVQLQASYAAPGH